MLDRLNVLIVDDDGTMLDVLSAFLEERGNNVTACGSGEDALAAFQTGSYDLVISDIEMAGMNGYELITAIRALDSNAGIVLMTAYDHEHPLSEALRAGADGYISKPFSLRKFSLIFEQAYWTALSRSDWWETHKVKTGSQG